MTPQELQKQVLQLSVQDRWQLVQVVLTSLWKETRSDVKPKNLSRLRGIAKGTESTEDYATYLSKKYQ